MSGMCPSCGYNYGRDEPIVVGDWHIVPNETAYWRKVPVTTHPSHVNILHTIAKANGRLVRTDALLNRVSNSDDRNLICVHVSKLRGILRKRNIPDPIETLHNRGYRWKLMESGEWQGIDTAPRDRIIWLSDGQLMRIGFWRDGEKYEHHNSIGGGWRDSALSEGGGPADLHFAPKYWQPLPDAPEIGQ